MAVQINARGEAELRDRIRRAARLADLSMNDWILRALESALGGAEESGHSPSDRSVAASSRTSANGAPESAPSDRETTAESRVAVAPSPTVASSRAPGDPAAEKAKREAAPDRRVSVSARSKQGVRPIPKAGKR